MTFLKNETLFNEYHRSFGLSLTYSSSCNLTPPISRVMISRHLIFAHPRDQRAVTRLQSVRQLNIKQGKKLSFQLSHS